MTDLASKVTYDWVGGDAIYGNAPELRQYLLGQKQAFVVDVGQQLKVYLVDPQPYLSDSPLGKGRKPTHLLSEQQSLALKELLPTIADEGWKTLS